MLSIWRLTPASCANVFWHVGQVGFGLGGFGFSCNFICFVRFFFVWNDICFASSDSSHSVQMYRFDLFFILLHSLASFDTGFFITGTACLCGLELNLRSWRMRSASLSAFSAISFRMTSLNLGDLCILCLKHIPYCRVGKILINKMFV